MVLRLTPWVPCDPVGSVGLRSRRSLLSSLCPRFQSQRQTGYCASGCDKYERDITNAQQVFVH